MEFICYRFAAMGGQNEIQLYAQTAQEAQSACLAGAAEVQRIEAKYSRYQPTSALSQINTGAGGRALPLDEETSALLGYADACFQASEGLFDITSGILRKAWDFNAPASQARVPSANALAPLLQHVGWQHVERTTDQIKLPDGMELDFGGIGKEYAADRASAVLSSLGIKNAMVNLSGDIRVLGPQPLPDGQDTVPWRIGITHPRHSASTLCTVAINCGALATSGDYERYLEIEGQRYCHILNPRTGMPVQHWHSVSVIAPLCVAAGSACTIAMLKGEAAIDFLKAQNISYLAVNPQTMLTSGLFATEINL